MNHETHTWQKVLLVVLTALAIGVIAYRLGWI